MNNNADEISKYLLVTIRSQLFAIPLRQVREILPLPKTTTLPHHHKMFRSVFNLRGKILSVADVRDQLNAQGDAALSSKQPIVIAIDVDGFEVGVVVDDIAEVANVEPTQISTEISGEHGATHGQYIAGIINLPGPKLAILINMTRLLNLENQVQV